LVANGRQDVDKAKPNRQKKKHSHFTERSGTRATQRLGVLAPMQSGVLVFTISQSSMTTHFDSFIRPCPGALSAGHVSKR